MEPTGGSRTILWLLVGTLVLGLGSGWSSAAAVQRSVLRVGAFNIRTFGKRKMSDEVVADRIKQIVERYDILLIQEIRDKSLDSVRQLLTLLELTDRVSLLDTYQYNDPGNLFEREPFVAKMAPVFANHGAISLIALHSKPESATAEIGHLRDVISKTLKKMGPDSEPVVLGDLNADCSYADLDKRLKASDYLTVDTDWRTGWLIGEQADTTTRASTDCAYDRIVIRSSLESRVVPNSNITFNFAQRLNLTEDEALDVSDHFPVEVLLTF